MEAAVSVSREEFEDFCKSQYPPDGAMKTMRRDKRDKIVRFLKGDQPPNGSWRYRMQSKGYTLLNFPTLGLEEVLCLKGTENEEGVIEHGIFGIWRKVLSVEEFYDILLEAHVKIQSHGGYKNLTKVLEKNYTGIPRDAISKFVSICSVCKNNPRQRLKTVKATEASRERVIKLSCVTRDFNRRCQIDLMDMSQNPDQDFCYVGVYTDHWTKFVTLFPMLGMSSDHIANALCASIFPYYGPPQFLHSQNGKEFADSIIQLAMVKWQGGEKTIIPKGKPGLMHLAEAVESVRQMMVQMINKRSMQENIQGQIPWARWLGKIMFDINNQRNSITGTSPYSRVFEKNSPSSKSEVDYSVKGTGNTTADDHKNFKRKSVTTIDNTGSVVVKSFKMPKPAGSTKRPHTFVCIDTKITQLK